MRIRTLVLAGTISAALALTGCSAKSKSSSADGPAASASATATGPGSAAATPTAGGSTQADSSATASGGESAKPTPPADAGMPTKPDDATVNRVVAALDAVNKDIVGGNKELAVDHARAACQMIYNFPKDRPKLVVLTNQLFSTPAHPDGFGPETADKILTAVQSSLCPTSP